MGTGMHVDDDGGTYVAHVFMVVYENTAHVFSSVIANRSMRSIARICVYIHAYRHTYLCTYVHIHMHIRLRICV